LLAFLLGLSLLGDMAGTVLARRAEAAAPGAPTAYVANLVSASITPINTTTNAAGANIGVGPLPFDVVVSPDGGSVYVGNLGANTVSVIDAATNALVTTIQLPSPPVRLAVAPDGTAVYVLTLDDTVIPIPTAFQHTGHPHPGGRRGLRFRSHA
jgi:YVTN family beta-propeller protein